MATSGGETKADPSGWTVDTLRAYFDERFREMDRRYEQRFESQQEAIRRAEQAMEKRFESVNEFRAQLSDQAAQFMPRIESQQRHVQASERFDALDKRLTEALSLINSRLDIQAGRSSGLDKGWALLVGAIVAAGAVIAIVLNLNP